MILLDELSKLICVRCQRSLTTLPVVFHVRGWYHYSCFEIEQILEKEGFEGDSRWVKLALNR
jgi:hypothetical protein